MKKFHKYGLLIVLALILALCVSVFAACTPEQDTTGLTNAKAYLKAQLINEPVSTPGDYTRPSALRNEQGSYTVVWTVSITSGPQTVTIVDNGDGTVTVDVQESAPGVNEDTLYTLTATITDANGNTDTLSFNHKIPKFAVNTFADYVAADKETDLVMEGIVTGILPKGNGATNDGYYMNTLDGEGGVYVFGTSGADLTVGQTVRVKGQKDNYSGTLELKNSTHEIINSEITAVTPVDFTAIYTAAENLKAEDLVAKQALLVTIKGVTVGTVGDNGYHYFSLAGKQSYVRISSSSCPMTTEKQTAMVNAFTSHQAYTADVTGVICVYDGKFYLTPVDENAFSNFVAPQLSDAELVAGAKDALNIGVTAIVEDCTINLPATGNGLYADVTISWELATTACATLEATELTVVLPEEATEITLTATLSKGEASDTVEITLPVDAATTQEYLPKYISAPAAGTYKIAMDTSAVDGKTLYFVGTLNDKGALETTENAAKAADVVIAAVDGKDGVYTIKVGEKYLEGFLSGNYNNMRLSDTAAEWTWNAEIGTFTCTFDNKDGQSSTFYFGAYLKNGAVNGNTMALSYISYVTGDNASKIGVSQFVGMFATLVEADRYPVAIEAPAAGTYKIAMDTSAVDGKTLYFVGTLNDKGALETTENAAKAADVVIAAVDGKDGVYTIKVGEKYLEGFLSGNYNNMRLSDTAAEWTWNAEIGTFTCTFDNKDGQSSTFYFGAYLKNGAVNGNTMALSYISYVTGDNASKIGVSQFVGMFVNLTLKETEFKAIKAPAAGTYKIAMDTSAVDGKILYFVGTLNDKGALETTEKYSKAADVVIAAVDGKDGVYTIKVGEKYLEGFLSGNYNNMRLSDTAAEWTWNAEIGTFTCTFDNKDGQSSTFYFGAYLKNGAVNGNTMALSYISYVTGDNASKIGVSQFVGMFGVKGFVEDEDEDEEPAETITTIEGALAGTDGTAVEISGTVTETQNSGTSFVITDGTNSILVYKPTTMAYPGDVVTVVGTLGSFQGTKQIAQGATVTITTAHNCAYGQATCTEPATCTSCGAIQTGSVALGHIDENQDKVCDRTDCLADLTKATISFADRANRTVYTTEQQVWVQDGITVTNDKASSTSNVGDYAGPARFYKNSSLTIACSGNMSKIVVTCGSADYATALQNSIAADANYTVTVDGSNVTIEFVNAVNSFSIAALGGGQVRVNSIEITKA